MGLRYAFGSRLGWLQVVVSVVTRLRSPSGSLSVVGVVVVHVETVVIPVEEAVVVVETLIASVRAIGITVITVAVEGRCTHLTMLAIRVMAVTVAPAKFRVRADFLIKVLAVPVSWIMVREVRVRHAERGVDDSYDLVS